MILKRTANAGILLALDGVKVLFDGVSREGTAYPATSVEEQNAQILEKPDALCFSHIHPDHYDREFAMRYKHTVGGQIIGPVDNELDAVMHLTQVGTVRITPIETRHIGKVGINVPHTSFIVEGTSCVWFLGDAAVLQWKNRKELPKPDVLIVPFAYATTATSWEITKNLGAKHIVIVHMPDKDNDPYQLWESVKTTVNNQDAVEIWIPDIGESKELVLF